jgi:prevent-host-death family protein
MASRKRVRHLQEEPASFRAGPGPREIAASDAKTHLSGLLDAVERGETIAITRHGRRIARLVPDEEGRRERVRKALDEIDKLGRKIRKEHGPTTIEEILAWRHEGHKY